MLLKPLTRRIPIVVVGSNDFVVTQAGNDVESLIAPSDLDGDHSLTSLGSTLVLV